MHKKFATAVASLFIAVAFMAASPAFAAEAKMKIQGELMDMNPAASTITVNVQGNTMKYKVADDAHWHVCLKDRCVEVKGAEGFTAVGNYAKFEEYGIPLKSYTVEFYEEKGHNVSDLEVEIVQGKHVKK